MDALITEIQSSTETIESALDVLAEQVDDLKQLLAAFTID